MTATPDTWLDTVRQLDHLYEGAVDGAIQEGNDPETASRACSRLIDNALLRAFLAAYRPDVLEAAERAIAAARLQLGESERLSELAAQS